MYVKSVITVHTYVQLLSTVFADVSLSYFLVSYYAYNVDIPPDKYVYLQLVHYLRYFVSDYTFYNAYALFTIF